nr:hypothetical protein [Teredinibacter haidensis]
MFNEAECEEAGSTTVKNHSGTHTSRVSNLPREEIFNDLPQAEKVCPHDGTELKTLAVKITNSWASFRPKSKLYATSV